MKKILLSVVALSFVGATQAQVAFSASALADFQTMAIIDADGDTFTWGVYDFMTANAGAPVGTSFDSQGELLGSFSYDNATQAALTPDNWVVTPALNLSALPTAVVSWGRASVDPDFEAENYSVYVVSAADQTALVAALVAATPVYTETIAVGDEWLTRSVNINSFAGQNNVYVAFRHHACTDMFLLTLDDIVVSATASIEENAMEVSMFPNPANDVLNVSVKGEMASVNVISLDGKVVIAETVSGTTATLNVADLMAGSYVLEVVGANGSVSRSNFIKK
jgi:hypothetical protein